MMCRRLGMIALGILAAACTVGPDYRKPAVPVPEAYKEAAPGQAASPEFWKQARPKDEAARGKWWEIFGDPALNALEEQVTVSNQTIAQAEAQYRGARAAVRQARAGLFPAVAAAATASRSSGVTNRASAAPGGAPPAVTAYQLPIDLSWELDVFGRIRRTVEAGVADAQAGASDFEAVRLAMHAELAVDYFTLRGLDAQKRILDSTAEDDLEALRITTNRHDQGIASGVDVAQAQTQLETIRAQAIDFGVARAQAEHALAILTGRPPADFSLARETTRIEPPIIPAGIPSDLLERRPDVAGAERRAAAANARIGIARAAYFPVLTLSASGGYQAATLADFFSLPNRFWSLGAALAGTLFDAGRRRAVSDEAWAAYDAAVALYRQNVLTAFQEVEDNLAALRILAEEADQQARAVAAAARALELARNRYQAGITSYLEVIIAQNAALSNERSAADISTRLLTAGVNLVKALGGGWSVSDLPYTDK